MLKDMRVLVAEDEPMLRHELEHCLQAWGYEPVLCHDGDDAWAALQQANEPQMIILDWNMPGKNGLDVCRLVRQQQYRPSPFILMLTIRNKNDDLVTALEAGADDYIGKPFNRMELKARLNVGRRILEGQQRLEYLLQESPAVIYSCAAEAPFAASFVSRNIMPQTGYAPDQFLDDPDFWLSNVHPDDRQAVMDALPQVFEHGQHTHEYRFRHADGAWYWMHDELRLIRNNAGYPIEIVGYWIDITERKRHELQLQLLESAVASVNESIVITDPDGVIVYVNPSFTSNTGYSEDEAIGHTPAILNSKQQSQQFYQQFWKTIKDGKPWSGRILDRRKDGTIFPALLSVAPIFDEAATISHFVAMHEDLTHSEAVQKKILQAQKMEAVGIMAGGMAHDFNNLMAGLMANIYMLQMLYRDDKELIERSRIMEQSIGHGAKLIQQLLTFASKDRTEMRSTELTSVVRDAFKMAGIPEDIECRLASCYRRP